MTADRNICSVLAYCTVQRGGKIGTLVLYSLPLVFSLRWTTTCNVCNSQQKAKEAEALDRELQSYRKAVKTLEADNKNKVRQRLGMFHASHFANPSQSMFSRHASFLHFSGVSRVASIGDSDAMYMFSCCCVCRRCG